MQAKERNDNMIEYTQSAEMHAETKKFQLGSRSDLSQSQSCDSTFPRLVLALRLNKLAL